MSKFTPGPWSIRRPAVGHDLGIIAKDWAGVRDERGGSNEHVVIVAEAFAELRHGGERAPEVEGNARLIAKSPDMRSLLGHCAEVLAACDTYVDIGDGEGSRSTVDLAEQIGDLLAEIDGSAA
jgi:hypothetical protein